MEINRYAFADMGLHIIEKTSKGYRMSYENHYLGDFASIFFAVLREKEINPAKVELIIFDEEIGAQTLFERTGVLDVLHQLREYINSLSVYTERPEYFFEFAELASEETGLITIIASKKEQNKVERLPEKNGFRIILDFERKGVCHNIGRKNNYGYIPIYKKPWEMRENLDIIVPFGYNTVIVKSGHTINRKFVNDRFDEGFYRDE